MAVNEPKKRMRGQHQSSSSPFGYVGLESRGPAKHPLRPGVTPHVAQNTYDTGRARQTSAIDGRTTRHPGYAASQRVRKRIEEVFGGSRPVRGSERPSSGARTECDPSSSSFIAGFNLVRIPKLLAEAHDMHFSRGDHTRWRSVASLLESYGAITGGETREEAVTQQSFINRQGDAIGDISVRRNRGAVGFDLWQNHRENAVDMSAPAKSCGPFGRGRGATL